ncbi:hypothetical protein [Pseudomonas tolaasii]|uniref:hypothetical protein n=1 Tax=Pseudomonas tolaasii TaxID=29442 RepID=UPI0015A07E55|nr:hypothetical protein [Pseudomonas tolaasii]MBW4792030.1 hypothetical protein [Pseudomonas tolaasii]NVZ43985.1 hypothetical protein [Pseudomonas tolaasii]NWA49113.1 hypothetical protein [Pseudomonas tolaasii]NWC27987.1 hypothetical protein [Pseudomonas tolaasii]NWC51893.1 hypothetical protein [Pseudomonas tolaasii]
MNEMPGIRHFLSQYFPVFMGAIFAAVFTLVLAVPLVFDSYFPHLPLADNAKYSFLGGLALAWVVVHCNFMIARGRPHWVWPLATLLGLCVLAVLPTIAYRPPVLLYGLSLLLPLLALLLLNSRRHREMRQKLLEVRHLREAAKAR